MDLDKIEVLDRSKNNWNVWLDHMQNYLLLKHGGGSEEHDFLCGYTNAHLAWDALKSHHEKVSPIAQILLIQQALAIKYLQSEQLSTMSTLLNDLIRRIYAIGIPKEDDFLTIMMLNAMAEDLPHVRNHITDALATSTSANPYGPFNIRSWLDIEQQLLNTKKSKGGNVTLAATGKGGNNHCSDHVPCATAGLPATPPEIASAKCAAHEAKNTTAPSKSSTSKSTAATGKLGGLRYNTNSESHQAIYMASAPEPTDAPTSSTEFAGLASDMIMPAFICELSDAGEDEYTMLLASVDSLMTSLDWHSHTHPVDFAGLTYKALNQHQCTIVDPSVVPMFLDSSVSVHISNEEGDFYSLCPIPPCSVNGVGGSSIQAIGIRTLCLIVARAPTTRVTHVEDDDEEVFYDCVD
ncbi:hypothetical protein EDD22DRAFT_854052 [Suillus occidentalis]|nr:hypothetical protein EDD22DRAFT_854052 [Suillus occidentalis]